MIKSITRTSVILNCLCAVIWTGRVVGDVILETYKSSLWLFLINALCAVVWIAALAMNVKRYRASKKSEDRS